MMKQMLAAVAVVVLGSSLALADSSGPRFQVKYIGPRNTPVVVRADRPAPVDQPQYALTGQAEQRETHRVLRYIGPRNTPIWSNDQR
jgi:hypothetical protein